VESLNGIKTEKEKTVNTLVYALAQAAPAAAPEGGMSGIMNMLLPLMIIFIIFWLLLIRPQQKKVKKHHEFISSLKKGDEVITSSGILGKIAGIADNAITLEIAEGVKIKVEKSYISGYTASIQSTSAEKAGNTGK
jgi:preprotein translocase subunit YajC